MDAHASRRTREAASFFRRVLERSPGHFDALQLLGLTLAAGGQPDDAVPYLRRALALRPGDAAVRSNLGRALLLVGRYPEAIAELRQAVDSEPSNPTIWLNLGNAQREANDHDGGIATLLALVQRFPGFAPGHFELGVVLRGSGRPREALLAFRQAIACDPAHVHARIQCALLEGDAGDPLAAAATLEAALVHSTPASEGPLRVLLAQSRMEICDWRDWDEACARVARAPGTDGATFDPLRAMIFPGTDAQMAVLTARYAATDVLPDGLSGARAARRVAPGVTGTASRIRIAYLSPDFGDHPVCRLIAPLLRRHDRTKFEVAAYGWGRQRDSVHRGLIVDSVDRFVDVGSLSDQEVAARLRADEVEIAVDLAGYTANCRPRIFLEHAAPVQVGWLGYPGTAGTGALQYLIADAVSIPVDAEAHFTERVVRLHGGFMPYDPDTPVAPPPPRSAYGLPDDAIVLACFGLGRKTNPPLFETWMAALRSSPTAVLWLSAAHPATAGNLRAAAAAAGVDPTRIVISPRAPNQAEYLARYRLADLALDTFPYGSHSTALDVLWAGCPLLAVSGASMASRVSASILTAAGMADLVGENLVEYQASLCGLVADRAALADLRRRATAARDTTLFDQPSLIRRLEAAFHSMSVRARAGHPPESFDVQ
jgi:predicted O-linked N-acetylglucosamine transferase (SPINDLY family)